LQQHKNAIGKSDQKIDVNRRPDEPRRDSPNAQETEIRNCVSPADNSQISLIQYQNKAGAERFFTRLRMSRETYFPS
jgi:hypothetical protein